MDKVQDNWTKWDHDVDMYTYALILKETLSEFW
jgi:hypothetical protein